MARDFLTRPKELSGKLSANTDRFNRKITYLRVSVTDRCNQRCFYCMPFNGVEPFRHSQILTYEEIARVVRAAVRAGIVKIRLTGGEPLVRKNICELVSLIANTTGIVDLGLTTNGALLGRMAGELFDAGLRRINVSLDTLNPAKFFGITGTRHFQDVLDGIETALETGFDPVKINMVAIRGVNDDELEDFAGLSVERPFHVRFIEYMPVGSAGDWSIEKTIPSNEILERLRKLGTLLPVPGNRLDGPSERYRFENAKGEIGLIGAVSNHFCRLCNRLRLTADGKLRPCLMSDEEVDIKSVLREGGSEERLAEVLKRAIALKPDGHRIDREAVQFRRSMSRIGG